MSLSERRAKDREAMARQVEQLAERYGWRCVRNDILTNSNAIVLDLTGGRGLSVSVDFDGKSTMPDNFCLAWHFTYKGDKSAVLSDRFGRFMGSSVNTVHRRKCTCFAKGFDTLLDKLEAAIQMVADGTAFLETVKEG